VSVEVSQDGLTYILKVTSPTTSECVETLMREECGIWRMVDCGPSDALTVRIGKRKTWQQALHDALVLMEKSLKGAP
jgi:hypothetical protein